MTYTASTILLELAWIQYIVFQLPGVRTGWLQTPQEGFLSPNLDAWVLHRASARHGFYRCKKHAVPRVRNLSVAFISQRRMARVRFCLECLYAIQGRLVAEVL